MQNLNILKEVLLSGRGLEITASTGITFSQFVPCIKNNYQIERAFLYYISNSPNKRRPFASLSLSSEDASLVEYNVCAINDFMDTEEHPLDSVIHYTSLNVNSADEQLRLMKKYDEIYSIIREFAFENDLTELQQQSIKEYREIFHQLVPVDLIVYYKALSPAFFVWIEKQMK